MGVSRELGVHLQGEGGLLEVLLEILAAALVLKPVDVVAVSHDLRKERPVTHWFETWSRGPYIGQITVAVVANA